jgi:hypothetical protein
MVAVRKTVGALNIEALAADLLDVQGVLVGFVGTGTIARPKMFA